MRALAELPFAAHLEPASGPVADGDYECKRFNGDEYKEPDLRGIRFSESVLTDLTFAGGLLLHGRFHDVWQRNVTMTGTSLADTSWRDTELGECAWNGVEAPGAELRRVEFAGCKLDHVNFRGATLDKVVFRDCVLRDPDFAGARLSGVTFPGSRVEGLALTKATLKQVDFRGAHSIGVSAGFEALRGAIIDHEQLLSLAPTLAAALGLIVED
ncbi:pentapeptide repeat-containing protein [Nocardia stercoris]|uniref:Pentapeptide repeat-containing protein n=1 Tax=Nocardia stercoris TaxID=2483361 RepID=A0A3M2L213_9NOCA|nr:pentapeptide repeat-containing protein [Nocardia stercoris]RMI28598.1 pentapeptide repeat-containing protein [Nocardia stercoris]